MRKYIFCLLVTVVAASALQAQELQANVTVLAQRVPSSVNKGIFTTLQTALTNLLNNRKWTSDTYQASEKIQCNFLVNIASVLSDNTYQASITVQAARPIYNSSYQSPLVNYQDGDFTFKYIEYQPVEFNENQIQGIDADAANLTATFAYYVYMILGFDYDSFSPKGGAPYFAKAENIVNNAPESRDITGWRSFDGVRNRYWLAQNITDTRFNVMHDVFYEYFRSGLDSMYTSDNTARASALDAINKLQVVNSDNQGSMIVQFFMQNRAKEFIGIFKNLDPASRSRAADLLAQIDVSNANNYKQFLQ